MPEISPPSSARNHSEGVEALLQEAHEGIARTPPHDPEGVLDGLVDYAFIPAGDEGADAYTCGPARWWRGLIEPGLHRAQPAHGRVAGALQELPLTLVGGVDVVLRDEARVPGSLGYVVARPAPQATRNVPTPRPR
jgi:hypothetical protein